MGNPHCVTYVDDVKAFPVERYGPLVENHASFPRRTNVEFVQVVSRTEVDPAHVGARRRRDLGVRDRRVRRRRRRAC